MDIQLWPPREVTSLDRRIQVIVTGGATLCRDALAAALREESNFVVTAAASPLAISMPDPADTVVVQLFAPPADGTDPWRADCDLPTASRCLLICSSLPREMALRLMQREIGGIFSIDNPLSQLPTAIRAVADGGSWLDPKYLQLLVRAVSGTEERTGLTARERAVLTLVAGGLTNKEIGKRLNISDASVKATLQRLFRKSGTRTRSQLVRDSLHILNNGL